MQQDITSRMKRNMREMKELIKGVYYQENADEGLTDEELERNANAFHAKFIDMGVKDLNLATHLIRFTTTDISRKLKEFKMIGKLYDSIDDMYTAMYMKETEHSGLSITERKKRVPFFIKVIKELGTKNKKLAFQIVEKHATDEQAKSFLSLNRSTNR